MAPIEALENPKALDWFGTTHVGKTKVETVTSICGKPNFSTIPLLLCRRPKYVYGHEDCLTQRRMKKDLITGNVMNHAGHRERRWVRGRGGLLFWDKNHTYIATLFFHLLIFTSSAGNSISSIPAANSHLFSFAAGSSTLIEIPRQRRLGLTSESNSGLSKRSCVSPVRRPSNFLFLYRSQNHIPRTANTARSLKLTTIPKKAVEGVVTVCRCRYLRG